jgi:hypothetical protein
MFGCSIFASGSYAHWQSALATHLSLVRMQGAAPDTRQRRKPDRRQASPLGVSFQWFRHRGHRPGWSR